MNTFPALLCILYNYNHRKNEWCNSPLQSGFHIKTASVSCALWAQTCLNNETPTQGVSNEDLTEIASVSMQQETSA